MQTDEHPPGLGIVGGEVDTKMGFRVLVPRRPALRQTASEGGLISLPVGTDAVSSRILSANGSSRVLSLVMFFLRYCCLDSKTLNYEVFQSDSQR